tara:strand:+ start:579 stop:959 length:381 start_codon:yes stop_codon:yes gene_type:complete
MNNWIFMINLGAIFGLLSVIIGALGAHSLESIISNKIDIFKTGVQYQMFHSLALILLGVISRITNLDLTMISYLFCAGIILFSGSLYLIAIFKILKFGIITPLGGLLFIAGWLLMIYKISSNHKTL